MEILVPEIVIWEWAEHAAAAYSSLQTQHQEFRIDPALYDRPTLPREVSTEALVRRIEALVPGTITIWRPHESAWKQAVMDQVLQVNTGERKEGIKTGAADSIVLACLREQVDERRGTEAVMLATNDKRLRSLCSQLFGDAVLLAGNIGDLLSKLNVFEPAEGELQEEVQQELEDRIRDARSQVGASLQTFEMGFRIDSDGEAASDRHPPRASRVLAQLGRVEIVELHGLRVSSQDGDERSGLADVRVFAEVHITQLELRDTAMGASEWVTTFDDAVDGGFIDLNIALIFDRHWQVRSASPAGPAVIVFHHYDDDDSDQVPDFHASAVESYGV